MTDVVEINDKEFVLVEERVSSTIEIENEGTVVVEEEKLFLVSENSQGPQGIQGIQGPQGLKGDRGDDDLGIDPTLLFENALI